MTIRCTAERIGTMVRIRLVSPGGNAFQGLLRSDWCADYIRMMGDSSWSFDLAGWTPRQIAWLRDQLEPEGVSTRSRLRRY